MSFIDSFRSRLKNDDEAEFERAFREGSWPEGVEDFEPMSNTGSFLPSKPDIDPLADESLPGNRMRREAESRASGVHDVYAQPAAPSPFGVIGAEAKPLPYNPLAGSEDADQEAASVVDEAAEGSVRVVERSGRRSAGTATSKPFADRLRERVEAAGVVSQQSRPAPRASSRPDGDREAPAGRSDMWNARRVRPGAVEEERADEPPRPSRSAPLPPLSEDAPRRSRYSDRPDARSEARASSDPIPVQCEVVRPRLYDEVSTIAGVVVGQHRPVVIVLSGSPADTSRRVLDFAFGLCCGCGAELNEIGHRVYALLPKGTALTDYDIAQLKRSGVMIRG